MAARIVLALVLIAIAGAIAVLLERRRRVAPPARGLDLVPQQVDRQDFPRPDAPWLVVLWSSESCESCRGLFAKIAPVESDDVAVTEVSYQTDPDLQRRYAIDAAPITIVVDAQGVTRASFAGTFEATELWATLAELRT